MRKKISWLLIAFLCFVFHESAAKSLGKSFAPVDSLLNQAIESKAFPSATLAVVSPDSVLYQHAYGHFTYGDFAKPATINTIYDLASLTKAFATTLSLMKLYEQGKFQLDDTYSKYFPSFAQNEKSSITIRQMMLHQSGLVPFRAYRNFCITKNDLIKAIHADTCIVAPGTKTVYSDLNFILLAELVAKLSGESFESFFRENIAEPLHLNSTCFTPDSTVLANIAPTEKDETWPFERNRPLVHDPNSALMGGVAGHAGLFSNIPDIIKVVQMLLNDGKSNGKVFFQPETLHLFTTRDSHLKSRALGWDLKSPGGKSSAGIYLSLSTYGHLGFTGTSVWIDPERKLGIIFLTNRVYPTSANKQIRKVRRDLHSLIIECLETDPKPTR